MMIPTLRFLTMLLPGALLAFAIGASASPAKTPYLCIAKIDCGAAALPSTQDLPSDENLIVRSASPEEARSQCRSDFGQAYGTLAKRVDVPAHPAELLKVSKGCRIVEEALPIQPAKKSARAPTSL